MDLECFIQHVNLICIFFLNFGIWILNFYVLKQEVDFDFGQMEDICKDNWTMAIGQICVIFNPKLIVLVYK